MNMTSLPPDVAEPLAILSQQSTSDSNAFSQFLTGLSKHVLNPLTLIIEKVSILQQQETLSPSQKELISQIQQLNKEIFTFTNNVTNQSSSSRAPILAPKFSENSSFTLSHEYMKGVHVLLISDNSEYDQTILTKLELIGLVCDASSSENALQRLLENKQKDQSPEIVILNPLQFDHHTAYLIRTLKNHKFFEKTMICLVLPKNTTHVSGDHAHLDGCDCILPQPDENGFLNHLADSWLHWSMKMGINIHKKRSSLQKRVLLVEDDPIPQKITQKLLHEMGYHTDLAETGEIAVKFMEEYAYDLIFMDIGLPDVSGLQLTEDFRKNEPEGEHTPIIGLTIYSRENDEKSGLEAGMDAYVIKPLIKERLVEILEKWVISRS